MNAPLKWLLLLLVPAAVFLGCKGDGECTAGTCACPPGASCAFECEAPPCHVDCDPGSDCSGACANGECTCLEGSTCDFTCDSGPCHVGCAGDNPECNGQCANGTCACGTNSSCAFECTDNNCHFQCGVGSTCMATCPTNTPGAQGCSYDTCDGEPQLCADGETIVCGAPCPDPTEGGDQW